MQAQSLRFLLVLDFEATCGDDIKGENEIIEFPMLVYDLQQDEVRATFHQFVRPVVHPTLTPFCTKLTGITQDVVDAADPFPVVWTRFQDFLNHSELLTDSASYAFLTCGNWDLHAMLPRQLVLSDSEHGLDDSGELVPPYSRSINIKESFRKHYRLRYEQGMLQMLQVLKLPLEGRHHSGIDDCKNILRIIRRMRADGWKPENDV